MTASAEESACTVVESAEKLIAADKARTGKDFISYSEQVLVLYQKLIGSIIDDNKSYYNTGMIINWPLVRISHPTYLNFLSLKLL